jgi:very-short-patch-repair endonuclease
MAGKSWSPEEDATLVALFDTHTAEEVAERLGRTKRAVYHRLNSLGRPKVKPGSDSEKQWGVWKRKLETRLGEPVSTYLERRYVVEQASYRAITAETGINTRSLMRLMREYNIEPIAPREAWGRTVAAHPDVMEKFHRKARSFETRAKIALHRQVSKSHMSDGEMRFLEVLNAAGLFPETQLAVLTYNIDFAWPDVKLGVEWDGRWHNSRNKRPRDITRRDKLEALGWMILCLDPRTSDEYNLKKVSDALRLAASTHPR